MFKYDMFRGFPHSKRILTGKCILAHCAMELKKPLLRGTHVNFASFQFQTNQAAAKAHLKGKEASHI
jgi:hypothetical protein